MEKQFLKFLSVFTNRYRLYFSVSKKEFSMKIDTKKGKRKSPASNLKCSDL